MSSPIVSRNAVVLPTAHDLLGSLIGPDQRASVLVFRKILAVVEYVADRASRSTIAPQLSTREPQTFQSKRVKKHQISIETKKPSNPVRDQGVGGSNPLSPTIKSRKINSLANLPYPATPELGSIWVQ